MHKSSKMASAIVQPSILTFSIVTLCIGGSSVSAGVNQGLVTSVLNTAKAHIDAKCFKSAGATKVLYDGRSVDKKFHGLDAHGTPAAGSVAITEADLDAAMRERIATNIKSPADHAVNAAAVKCALDALKKVLATGQEKAQWFAAVLAEVGVNASCQ